MNYLLEKDMTFAKDSLIEICFEVVWELWDEDGVDSKTNEEAEDALEVEGLGSSSCQVDCLLVTCE